eukprot:jgi/Galph1/5449/GphlegSOOS_G4016.1
MPKRLAWQFVSSSFRTSKPCFPWNCIDRKINKHHCRYSTHQTTKRLFSLPRYCLRIRNNGVAKRYSWTCIQHINRVYSTDSSNNVFDVVVVGGGHAGVEAALAAAKRGAKTILLTLNLDRIAWQPCNPAVGGPAKSTLVHEVDALGGWIGKLADRTYLQRRILNRSKGPAVWALRAQTDKREYSEKMRQVLDEAENLVLREGMVTDIILGPNGEVTGVETFFGGKFVCKAVVLTTGTFLRGTIWVGSKSMPAGRAGEMASFGLTDTLQRFGYETDRLKTGTPARVDSRTIDYSRIEPQYSDSDDHWFSFDPREWNRREVIPCYITRTTEKTHQIIRENLHRTPKYGGFMTSVGPRYCPSIEDKIVRFADKESHQIFIEPEGRTIHEAYIQGFSTGMPEDIQLVMLQSVTGLESCKMVRPAYSVDYDYLPATQLFHTLQTKHNEGLFLAGQICGTTGYEEAAAQGLVAGINASLFAEQKPLLNLSRESSFIGTMIDDLCTKELKEPYRVLTSRSEYRLLLRADNADERLTPLGRQLGLVDDYRWKIFQEKYERIEKELKRLSCTRIKAEEPIGERIRNEGKVPFQGSIALQELLKRPGFHYTDLKTYRLDSGELETLFEEETVETRIKYSGYLHRQEEEIRKLAKSGHLSIPLNIDYSSMTAMRKEAREKLSKLRPTTIGQASRIGGVNPTDISILLVYLERENAITKQQGRDRKEYSERETVLLKTENQ